MPLTDLHQVVQPLQTLDGGNQVALKVQAPQLAVGQETHEETPHFFVLNNFPALERCREFVKVLPLTTPSLSLGVDVLR